VLTPIDNQDSRTFLKVYDKTVDWSAAKLHDFGDYKVTVTAAITSDAETCSQSTHFLLRVALQCIKEPFPLVITAPKIATVSFDV
jgi:hypothetical protein